MRRSPDITVAERRALAAVARGGAHADLYLRGATLLSVYTGEIAPANVAVAGERIAYVGLRDDMVGPGTRVVDVPGRILVPGYIDPHVHPAHLVTPSTLAGRLLPLGATTLVADTLQFLEVGGFPAFRLVADALATSPLKFFWMVRAQGQTSRVDELRRFPLRALDQALGHPWTIAAGEFTRWPELHRGDPALFRRLALAERRGLRVEGHTAGASAEKIPGIAAGGVTSDHEPITAQEVLERARHGIAVMLRESSLRPDLSGLLDVLKQAPALLSRLMLTCDGAMPAFVRTHGFLDHALRVVLDRGVAPIDAYRMVSLNPATYFGRDGDLGGIAPGRFADICVLEDLAEPRPQLVVARGAIAAVGSRLEVAIPEVPWRQAFASPRARLTVGWRARPDDFALPSRHTFPVIRLVSAVITRREDRPREATDLHAALLDRGGRWVAPALLAGFGEGVDGLASTITNDFNILALGRRPESIARAVNRLLELGGGIVLAEGPDIAFELPLPLGGIMSGQTFDSAADAEEQLHAHLAGRGYAFHDALFTCFFLSADFLPHLRLSPRGVWDVRRSEVVIPARRRQRR